MMAAGALECVWRIGYESGDPFVGDARLVEYACEWRGKQGDLAAALVEAGFLDATEDGGLLIHDLLHHAPDYVLKRFRREAARRSNGAGDPPVSGQCPVSGRPLTSTPTPAPAPTPKKREREARATAPAAPPPSLSEVAALRDEKGLRGDPATFLAYREAYPGWGGPDWRKAFVLWSRRENAQTREEQAASDWGLNRPPEADQALEEPREVEEPQG